jgi:hypothetical protein
VYLSVSMCVCLCVLVRNCGRNPSVSLVAIWYDVRQGGVALVQVTETFNKIGMPNTSMMGLETLYNLLEENPSFPVEDLLSRTSEPFRQYISKGLHKVLLYD